MSQIYRYGSRNIPSSFLHTVGGVDALSWTFLYHGRESTVDTAMTATVGSNLTVAATVPAYKQSQLMLNSTEATWNATGTSSPGIAPATSTYDLTTDDVMAWAVVVSPADNSTNYGIFGKADFNTSNDFGYWLAWDTSARFWWNWSATSDFTAAGMTSAALSNSTVYMVHAFMDQGEASATTGGQIYVNGHRSGSGADFSGVSSVTNSYYFKALSKADTTGYYKGKVGSYGMVSGASLWPGGSDNLIAWDYLALDMYKRWQEGRPIG